MCGNGADTDNGDALAIDTQSLFQLQSDLLKLRRAGGIAELMDQDDVRLSHGKNEAGLTVGEDTLHRLHRYGLDLVVRLADDEHAAAELRIDMELLGADINIADENVVGNNAFDEGRLVILLFVIALGRIEGNGSHCAGNAAHLVLAEGERREIKLTAPAGQGLEGLALKRDTLALCSVDRANQMRPLAADLRQIRTGDHRTLGVDHPDDCVGCFFKLQNDILKNSTRHAGVLPKFLLIRFVHFVNRANSLYLAFQRFARDFFFFHQIFCLFLLIP